MDRGLPHRGFLKQGLGLGLLASILLAACASTPSAGSPGSSGAAAGAGTLARITADKLVRVGFANEAPYGFASADGKLTGEAPEVLRAYFKSIGVENLEGVLTDFGSLIPGLQANRFDVVGAGMFIRPARCEQIAFGDPDYRIGEAFAVKKGNPLNLHTLKDVAASPTAKFGSFTGTVEFEYADTAGVSKDRQVVFPDGPTLMAGLQAGRIDVAMLTTLSIRDLLKKTADPNLEYVALTEQPVGKDGKPAIGYGAMGFRKEDTDLRESYNTWLAKVKASGELATIIQPFGFTAEDVAPADVKAATACAG